MSLTYIINSNGLSTELVELWYTITIRLSVIGIPLLLRWKKIKFSACERMGDHTLFALYPPP